MKRLNISTIIILTLFIAFLIRLPLTPIEGDPYDLGNLKSWTKSTVTEGVLNAPNIKSYPNLPFPSYLFYLILLKPLGIFYQHFISPSFAFNNIGFNILLKIFPILFDLLTGLFIFLILRKSTKLKWAYLAMLFYLFNPAIIYESSYWGQTDSIHTLFILSSVFLSVKKKFTWSWICMAIGIFFKFQTIIILPLVFLLNLKGKRIKNTLKNLLIFFILIVLVFTPFFIIHKENILRRIATSISYYPWLSSKAFNIWWPVQIIKGQLIQDTDLIFSPINYRHIGLIMFACAYVFVLYFLNKKHDSKSIWLAASFVALAFFMLPTEMHERYLFPIFALLSMIWIQNKKLWPVYGILSVTFFLNLIYALPLPFMSEASRVELGNASVAIVLVNLGVFIYFIRLMVQQLRQPKYAD